MDDRLPIRKGSPIYMRSASSVEMWPSLLEKAYAKAKGSYELLNRYSQLTQHSFNKRNIYKTLNVSLYFQPNIFRLKMDAH